MSKSLAQKIKELPQTPGVYIFKDARGMFLYVGKAIKLKNRVASYFRSDAGMDSPRIKLMISQIADLDFVVTDNELESLVLENNFIKQIQPKYNVRLRDDKNYQFIKIKIADEIPTISTERKLTDKSARYFGPYTSGQSVKETLRLLRKVFPYCANSKVSTRPCFYYHIGKCPGVCFGKVSLAEYRQTIAKIIRFLEGRQTEVLNDLKKQMRIFAARKKFEKAAKIRDQIFALNRVLERQKLVYPRKIDQDVFSLYQDSVSCINLFMIRQGKLIGKENFILENTKQLPAAEILQSFLQRYYLEASSKPKEILLPVKIDEQELPTLLSKVKILIPSRGPKLDLIKLGTENAKQYLQSQSDRHLLEEIRAVAALRELQRVLGLAKLPGRIEAYDISNIQGTNATGSMVVFDFARPKKEAYRKFKISAKGGPDDFAMMAEMLERRLNNNWPLPDLILIDGGKGQLNAALKVLKKVKGQKSKVKSSVIGLAKRLEEIFVPGKPKALVLPKNSMALFLLQRIRDEAHRFALTYHKKLRSKTQTRSFLDQISGIGEAKKRKLLATFGSVSRLKNADITKISSIVGRKLAEKIKASLV